MNLIDLLESNFVINPLAIAYLDCNKNEGASDGGCKVHLLNGEVLVISGDEANEIISENDQQNYMTPIAEEMEAFRKDFFNTFMDTLSTRLECIADGFKYHE
jgi:hypothetical protein